MNLFCSKIKREVRKSICDSCDFQRGDFKLFNITIFKRTKQCRVCKCSIYFKTQLKDAKCPLDKW